MGLCLSVSRCEQECGGVAICQHGRQRQQCKDCGGSAFCSHGRRKRQCPVPFWPLLQPGGICCYGTSSTDSACAAAASCGLTRFMVLPGVPGPDCAGRTPPPPPPRPALRDQ
eukprot:252767-Rhodomonas_salina.1